MTTATELLRRAYEALDRFAIYDDLRDSIEDFLAVETEAEPVFIRPDHLALARKSPFLCQVGPVQVADFIPLYTRPEPARKPMTHEEIIQRVTVDTSDDFHAGYWAGIRFAEKHHGIGWDDA